jgi:dienelactone hydrolase
MKAFVISLLVCFVCFKLQGQEAVYFQTADSLTVRADLYINNLSYPFIVLCHQNGSNRTEYDDIAPRLLHLEYNCLAIDLRAGGTYGYAENETNRMALEHHQSVQPVRARDDIQAALAYVKRFNDKPVVLFGSAFSASLCLMVAENNPRVRAVVALDPGEYFQPLIHMADEISRVNKPVFIGCSAVDYDYLQKLVRNMSPELVTLFKPQTGEGARGTAALKEGNPTRNEYWFALTLFFKKLV